MVLTMTTFTIFLLALFAVSDLARVRLGKVMERGKFVRQPSIASHNNEGMSSVSEDMTAKADPAADHVMALESPGALAQVAASESSVAPQTSDVAVRTRLGVASDAPPSKHRKMHSARNSHSNFSKTLDCVSRVRGDPYQQEAVLKAACDSIAFSCDEIIQLIKGLQESAQMSFSRAVGVNGAIKLFAEARNNRGCISDPENTKSIVDAIESNYDPYRQLDVLTKALIENKGLQPARDLEPQPTQLQTGFRTRRDMQKLLAEMAELQLIKDYASQGSEKLRGSHKLEFTIRGRWAGGLYQPGGSREKQFESWLKQISASGEQFSGSQLVSLVQAIPPAPLRGGWFEHGTWKGDGLPERDWSMREKMERNSGTAQAASVLLQYLEQYLAGVTCKDIELIIQHAMWAREEFFFEGLHALKPNVIDGQNKVDLVALTYPFGVRAERVLKDVGVGLPPQNNPIFGVVKGNPVIFVLDESTTMDSSVCGGVDTVTCRQFCSLQLETVLEGLPNGTFFNIIQYSSAAAKIFQKPVPANKSNIDAAMHQMGKSWRASYIPGQDPVKMLRSFKMFALQLKDHLNQDKRNSMEALRLAYATADLPSGLTHVAQHRALEEMADAFHGVSRDLSLWIPEPLAMAENLPQIYFVTSGQPDGRSTQIFNKIDVFDKGRSIPVNSIAFTQPADTVAKQFAKDLARKTGGFFRTIE